jgi:hypothetical protein
VVLRSFPAASKPPTTYRRPSRAAAAVSSTGFGKEGSSRCPDGGSESAWADQPGPGATVKQVATVNPMYIRRKMDRIRRDLLRVS